jgi:hypothetical protein
VNIETLNEGRTLLDRIELLKGHGSYWERLLEADESCGVSLGGRTLSRMRELAMHDINTQIAEAKARFEAL